MKVLITGGTGQVGHSLLESKPDGMDAITPGRAEFDLARPATLDKRLHEIAPDAVINAGAYTAVDKAENEPELAKIINADAVEVMAKYCRKAHIPLLQMSTDFVFNGKYSRPYKPEDQTDPIGVYSWTKLAGEEAALNLHDDSYVIRASWIHNEYGNNFVKTMMRLAQAGTPLRVVDDQTGTPTYARYLAKALWRTLEIRPEQRLMHFADGGETTWYKFAVAVFEETQAAGILTCDPDITPVTSAEYRAAVERPVYSAMDCSLTYSQLKMEQVPWREALHDMVTRLSTR